MSYREYLKTHKDLVGMIHLAAMPGTPAAGLSPSQIIERAIDEARLYQQAGLKTVMIENMHDVPYADHVGGEVTGLPIKPAAIHQNKALPFRRQQSRAQPEFSQPLAEPGSRTQRG